MPNINFLIKPSSSRCNMNCSYCFYHDIAENRNVTDYGLMTLDTAENLIRKASDFSGNGQVTFAFQGGEPTLVGIEFYKEFLVLVDKYFENSKQVHFALQTNGLLIDEKWAKLFSDNSFLIGLSIDGTKDVHDLNRLDYTGKGTHKRVQKAAELLSKHGVDFNVLTVVSKVVTRKIRSIYKEYKSKGYKNLQFIPCLDPLEEERGLEKFSLKPKDYTNFLINLFDLWYKDILNDERISIRFFDNILGMFLGMPPESCDMIGRCSLQHVIEADGSIYPCDFYVLDAFKLGNINTDDLTDIHQKPIITSFIEESFLHSEKCQECQWLNLCRGGCKRNRDENHLNYFCESFKEFYDYSYQKFQQLAVKMSTRR